MKRACIVIMLCWFSFGGCDFSEDPPVDYREEYIGNYSFKIVDGRYILDTAYIDSGYWMDTIYTYNGCITISEIEENRILVSWGTDTIIRINGVPFTQRSDFLVDSFGNLDWPEYGGFSNTDFGKGRIYGDTIKFVIYWGGLGIYGNYSVTGNKIYL